MLENCPKDRNRHIKDFNKASVAVRKCSKLRRNLQLSELHYNQATRASLLPLRMSYDGVGLGVDLVQWQVLVNMTLGCHKRLEIC
jgi:hypothetical protein